FRRTCDFFDAVADWCGGLGGLFFFLLFSLAWGRMTRSKVKDAMTQVAAKGDSSPPLGLKSLDNRRVDQRFERKLQADVDRLDLLKNNHDQFRLWRDPKVSAGGAAPRVLAVEPTGTRRTLKPHHHAQPEPVAG